MPNQRKKRDFSLRCSNAASFSCGEEIHSAAAQDKTPLLGIRAEFFFTLVLLLVFAMSTYKKARKLRKIRIDVCNQAARRALDIFMNRIIALWSRAQRKLINQVPTTGRARALVSHFICPPPPPSAAASEARRVALSLVSIHRPKQ
jgi:hypothetical protein